MGAVVSILTMFLGIGLIFMSIASYIKTNEIIHSGTIAKATVIDIVEEVDNLADNGPSVSYYPIIEYMDSWGIRQEHRFTSTSDLIKYVIGQDLNIVYNPQNLTEVVVLDRFGIWGDVFGYFLSGFLTLGLGFSFLF